MSAVVAANRKFLDTGAAAAAQDWHELLKAQVDLSLAHELNLLGRLPSFLAAKTVLDAGCGNAYYLSRLREFFPDKAYRGVDISPELIEAAQDEHPDLDVEVGNYFTLGERHATDVLVMRFLVQHLGDFPAILRQAERLLPRGRTLLVIESDLGRSLLKPVPQQFIAMLQAFHRISSEGGGVRQQLLADPEGLVARSAPNWSVTAMEEAVVPMTGPFSGGKLLKVFRTWVDLAERASMFGFDFNAVRTELDIWAARREAFAALSIRVFELRRG